jgi:hypothetical protein
MKRRKKDAPHQISLVPLSNLIHSSAMDEILELNLTNSNLTEFPVEILQHTSLEILRLDGNHLTNLPEEILQLTNLKILFLGGNKFTVFPKILGQMSSLIMISFKSNLIAHISEEALSPSIRWLILTDNLIESLPSSIGKLTKLKKLMLANNRLSSLPDEMSQCQELELIRLASNQFQEIPNWLFEISSLSWIALAGNPCFPTPIVDPLIQRMISPSEVLMGEKIGEGASGVIFKATPIGSSLSDLSHDEYAIKYFKNGNTSDGNPLDEKDISLSLPSHPSLVPVLGTIINPETQLTGLIFPLIPSSYISLALPPSFATMTRDVYRSDDSFTPHMTLSILSGIASCCALLHSQSLMHGDLYGHNILIPQRNSFEGETLNPYLVDFGAATSYHLSPPDVDRALFELIEVNAFSKLFDELLSRTTFPDNDEMKFSLQSLCNACSSKCPRERPRFHEIALRLASLTMISHAATSDTNNDLNSK